MYLIGLSLCFGLPVLVAIAWVAMGDSMEDE
jgi:hypothetical protein